MVAVAAAQVPRGSRCGEEVQAQTQAGGGRRPGGRQQRRCRQQAGVVREAVRVPGGGSAGRQAGAGGEGAEVACRRKNAVVLHDKNDAVRCSRVAVQKW